MKVGELVERLTELVAEGHGDARVIDNSGNDVAEVHAPNARPEYEDEDDDDAVVLTCYAEYRGQ